MKVPTARFGEHRAFEQLEGYRPAPGRPKQDSGPLGGQEPQATWGPMIEGLGDGFSWKSQDLEHSAQLARDGWQKARAAILGGDYFLVVLDEITYPLIYGWLPLDDVLETLKTRPGHVHVVLTGRRCPTEIIELADTVTEMQMVKHAFKAGIPAQRGIED
jgi:cob(I)alamin adenosyltransferase